MLCWWKIHARVFPHYSSSNSSSSEPQKKKKSTGGNRISIFILFSIRIRTLPARKGTTGSKTHSTSSRSANIKIKIDRPRQCVFYLGWAASHVPSQPRRSGTRHSLLALPLVVSVATTTTATTTAASTSRKEEKTIAKDDSENRSNFPTTHWCWCCYSHYYYPPDPKRRRVWNVVIVFEELRRRGRSYDLVTKYDYGNQEPWLLVRSDRIVVFFCYCCCWCWIHDDDDDDGAGYDVDGEEEEEAGRTRPFHQPCWSE